MPQWPKDIKPVFKAYRDAILAELINGVFTVLWAILQYITSWVIKRLELTGFDAWVFFIFQIIFAISTGVFILFQIYRDTRILLIRINNEIEEAKADYGNPPEP